MFEIAEKLEFMKAIAGKVCAKAGTGRSSKSKKSGFVKILKKPP